MAVQSQQSHLTVDPALLASAHDGELAASSTPNDERTLGARNCSAVSLPGPPGRAQLQMPMLSNGRATRVDPQEIAFFGTAFNILGRKPPFDLEARLAQEAQAIARRNEPQRRPTFPFWGRDFDSSVEAAMRSMVSSAAPSRSSSPAAACRAGSPSLEQTATPEAEMSKSLIVVLKTKPLKRWRCNNASNRAVIDFRFPEHACKQTFARSHDLIRHLRTIASKKVECEIGCGQRFARRDAMQRHVRKVPH